MAKSCSFAVMLAVICLSVILSLEADAHPVTPWSAATLEVRIVPSNQQQGEEGNWQSNGTCSLQDVMNTIASNQQQNAEQIRDVKKVLVSGSVETNNTRLEEVKEEIKNAIRDEIRDAMKEIRDLLVSGSGESNETKLDDVVDMVKMIASNQQQNAKEIKHIKEEIRDLKKLTVLMIHYDAAEPSEAALVSALVYNCTPLLIQQHVNNGSDFFNRSWAEFKVGFGDPSGNYWLGNDLLSQLTANNRYKLRFDLQSRSNSNWYNAEYSMFRVLTEADDYKLEVAGYAGNARDSLTGYRSSYNHTGMMFTTYDRDNDLWSSGNCAVGCGGGFWYTSCGCLVNSARSDEVFRWYSLPGGAHLQTSRMWLECK